MFIPSIFGGNFSYPERISSPIPPKNGAATYNFHYASNCFENLVRHSLKLLFLFQRVFTRATLVLAMVVCLRLSCHKPVFYRNDSTNPAGFDTGASFDLSYTVL